LQRRPWLRILEAIKDFRLRREW